MERQLPSFAKDTTFREFIGTHTSQRVINEDNSPLIRQCIFVGPRPASRSMRRAKIDERIRVRTPKLLQTVIGHERELPYVASIERNAVGPRAFLRAASDVVIKVQPNCKRKEVR